MNEKLKSLVSQFLRLIDNGKFFIIPTKWLYVLMAVLVWFPPFLTIYGEYEMYDNCHYMLDLDDGWNSCLMIIMDILYILVMMVMSYLSTLFWLHRKHRLDEVVHVGDNIVAIPLGAYSLQNFGLVPGSFRHSLRCPGFRIPGIYGSFGFL